MVVRVTFERFQVLLASRGVAQKGAGSGRGCTESRCRKGRLRERGQGVRALFRFPERGVDLGTSLERGCVAAVDLESPVEPAGRRFEIAPGEVVQPGAESAAGSDS